MFIYLPCVDTKITFFFVANTAAQKVFAVGKKATKAELRAIHRNWLVGL